MSIPAGWCFASGTTIAIPLSANALSRDPLAHFLNGKLGCLAQIARRQPDFLGRERALAIRRGNAQVHQFAKQAELFERWRKSGGTLFLRLELAHANQLFAVLHLQLSKGNCGEISFKGR